MHLIGIIWNEPEKLYLGDDMLLAAFIILIIIAVGLLPLTFTAAAKFDDNGFSLNLRVRLAHAITLYGWDSDEEGLSFLFKKRVKKEDKKNRRIKKTIRRIFSPDSLLNIKGMTITKFEVLGVIATSDAAKTAILYGSVCAVISAITPHLRQSRATVDFHPDFQKKKPDFLISCIIRIRVIHIIYLIASLLVDKYLKGRWHSLWNRILLKS